MCSELYLCREHGTNTRRWGRTSSVGINSEIPLIVVYGLFLFITLNRKYHRAMNNNSFLHHQWVDSPSPALNHSQAAGNPREGKANLKSPRYPLKFQKMSKIHWVTKSHDSSRRQAHLHHLFVCRGQCLMSASQMDENLNLNYSLTDYKFPLLHERNI